MQSVTLTKDICGQERVLIYTNIWKSKYPNLKVTDERGSFNEQNIGLQIISNQVSTKSIHSMHSGASELTLSLTLT